MRRLTGGAAQHVGDDWWRGGVVYQIYPRSFCDSNGDGTGDLGGVIEKLDYLEWLGVEAIWLSPIFRSPMADHGYDVSDYQDIDPLFGTLADADLLIEQAHRRHIRVLFDFVPNHTSSQHPWFVASRRSREDPKRDWYWWRDPNTDGGPPNNWLSHFGGPAWTMDEATGQFYLHLFLPEQPDLNWANPAVVQAMHDVLRFWLRRGIDGYRIDVAHALAKDPLLRDDPPHPDPERLRAMLGQRAPTQLRIYSQDRPEVHDLIRGFRHVLDEFGAVAVGEVYLLDVAELVRYFGTGRDQLHLAFNFEFLHNPWNAAAFRTTIERTESLLGALGAWPTWTLSNHDNERHATRYGVANVKAAALILLGLRGTPFLYYGEELGMPDVDTPHGDDVVGRDPARAPMRWDSSALGGFTSATPWLPLPPATLNVEDQALDPDSTLSFYRDLITLRKRHASLRIGRYSTLPSPASVLAWRRGDEIEIAVNLGVEESHIVISGTVIAATTPARVGETIGSLGTSLQAGEGVMLRRSH